MTNSNNEDKKCIKCNGTGKYMKQVRTTLGIVQKYVSCPDCKGTGIIKKHFSDDYSTNKIDLITNKIIKVKEKIKSILFFKIIYFILIISIILYLSKMFYIYYPYVFFLIYIFLLIVLIVVRIIRSRYY